MRVRESEGDFSVQVIMGSHTALLGFDMQPEGRSGLLGFALHRTDHTEDEAYWLPGFKTFERKRRFRPTFTF